MEICVDSIESARNAAIGGATRLLLCSALEEGGLTPSLGMLQTIKRMVHIPVFCMLRCRPGNYCFTPAEISAMEIDARLLVEKGADGIAFGAVTKEGAVDLDACRQILKVIYKKQVQMTFNRAFDWTKDAIKSLSDVHSLERFTRILTTGQASVAEEGVELLSQLVKESEKLENCKIKIVPANGVTPKTIAKLHEKTGCVEFHASATAGVKFEGHLNPGCCDGDAETKICQAELVGEMALYLKHKRMDLVEMEKRVDIWQIPPGMPDNEVHIYKQNMIYEALAQMMAENLRLIEARKARGLVLCTPSD